MFKTQIGLFAALAIVIIASLGCRSRSRLDATLPGAVIHYDGMTSDAPPAKTPAVPDKALTPVIFTPVPLPAPPEAPKPLNPQVITPTKELTAPRAPPTILNVP